MKLTLAQILKKVHREQLLLEVAEELLVDNNIKSGSGKYYTQQEVLVLLKCSKPKFIPVDRCGIARHLNDCGDASDY